MIGEGGNSVLSVHNFSGGMTDFPLKAKPHQAAVLENFMLTENDSLLVRDGSAILEDSVNFFSVVQAEGQTGDLIYSKFGSEDKLFVRTKSKILHKTATWVELQGPAGSTALQPSAAFGVTSITNWSKWNDQIFITAFEDSGIYSKPMKIFKDDSDTYRVYNAGLPRYPDLYNTSMLADSIALANDIKAKLNTHYADLTAHSTAQATITTANASDMDTLKTLTEAIVDSYSLHARDVKEILFVYHFNLSTDEHGQPCLTFYPTTRGDLDLLTIISTLNELKKIYNLHANDIYYYLPAIGSVTFANIHGGSSTSVSVSDVDVYSEITITQPGISGSGRFFYLVGTINTLAADLLEHFQQVAGPEYYHTGSFYSAIMNDALNTKISTTTYTEERIILIVFQLWLFYQRHRDDATYYHNADTENAATDTSLDLTILENAPDMSTEAGCDYIFNVVKTVGDKFHEHFNTYGGTSARHSGTTADTDLSACACESIEFEAINLKILFSNEYSLYNDISFIDKGTPAYRNYPAREISADIRRAEYGIITTPTAETSLWKTNLEYDNFPTYPAVENYSTSTIKVEFYREHTSGIYYLQKSIAWADTSFESAITQDALALGTSLYTTGGLVENDPPPRSKVFTITNNIGWYGGIVDEVLDVETTFVRSDVFYPTRLRQSIQNDPDSCPGSFYYDFASPIKTLGAIKGTPIVVCEKGVYRVEGIFTLNGSGGFYPTELSSSIGGVSYTGGVTANDLFFFAGIDGFYVTDGFKVTPISTHLKKTYKELVVGDKTKFIKGEFSPLENSIYWCMTSGSSYDEIWVLDLGKPLSHESSFTKLIGGTNFAPSAICFWQNSDLYRGDIDGFIFKHSEDLYADPRINRSVPELYRNASSEILTAYIAYDYLSAAFDFDGGKMKKWVTQFDLIAQPKQDITPEYATLSVLPYYINDLGRLQANCLAFRYQGSPTGLLEQKRHFPAGGFRCIYKQLGFTNANVILTSSDVVGSQVHINSVLKTATLDSGFNFPVEDLIGLELFVGPNYATGYTINDTNDGADPDVFPDTLVLDSSPATASYDWYIKGYPKHERLEIHGFNIPFTVFSNTRDSQHSSGANK